MTAGAGGAGTSGSGALLLAAARVAALDADLADDLARGQLAALTDRLAHAMVDLATGRRASAAAGHGPVPPSGSPGPTGSGEPTGPAAPPAAPDRAAVRASCSAAAAELVVAGRAVQTAQAAPPGPSADPDRDVAAGALAEHLERLAAVLQEHAQEPEPGAPAARQRLRRGLRALDAARPDTVQP